MDLRSARREDVAALTRLIERSVTALMGAALVPDELPLWLAHVFGVDTQLIDDGTYYVVDGAEGLAAAGGWGGRATLYGGDARKAGTLAPRLDPARDAARIRAFYVDPDHARRGLGSRILAHAEAAARAAGFRRMELLATPTGEPLYARHGYVEVAREEVKLRNGSSYAWPRMEKVL
jgi:N-acetylglutamate synthase-like GNAT family acetyltransferase